MESSLKKLRVAVVHDWLSFFGGAERVLKNILEVFPNADVFTLIDFIDRNEASFINQHKVYTSFIQKLPLARKYYRHYLPLMPIAIEQFNLTGYDLVISSSFAVAKGVITAVDQIHISYVHSPMRYAWDLQFQYLKESGLENGLKGAVAKYLLHKMRMWDCRTANSVDYYIANSNFIAKRIWKLYRRKSEVIFPPVDIPQEYKSIEKDKDLYVTVSRLVPYKKVDLIVRAFNRMPEKQLVVIGDGPFYKKIKQFAGHNVHMLGYQATSTVREYLARASAFVFAALEDFGIVPVEAQAYGTPIIAYGRGGIRDTVIDRVTGVFFDEQTEQSLVDAIEKFEVYRNSFSSEAIMSHARQFGSERFRREFSAFICEKL